VKIYTKTGDDGTTGLFNGQRVPKYSERVECYGTVDELNSFLGIARIYSKNDDFSSDLKFLSNRLFNLGSDLATPLTPTPKFEVPRITEQDIKWLEQKMDSYEEHLKPLRSFILPGGSQLSAHLHICRTVCRRAERLAVMISEKENLGKFAVIFLNRLSDYFFMASRYANYLSGIEDNEWEK